MSNGFHPVKRVKLQAESCKIKSTQFVLGLGDLFRFEYLTRADVVNLFVWAMETENEVVVDSIQYEYQLVMLAPHGEIEWEDDVFECAYNNMCTKALLIICRQRVWYNKHHNGESMRKYNASLRTKNEEAFVPFRQIEIAVGLRVLREAKSFEDLQLGPFGFTVLTGVDGPRYVCDVRLIWNDDRVITRDESVKLLYFGWSLNRFMTSVPWVVEYMTFPWFRLIATGSAVAYEWVRNYYTLKQCNRLELLHALLSTKHEDMMLWYLNQPGDKLSRESIENVMMWAARYNMDRTLTWILETCDAKDVVNTIDATEESILHGQDKVFQILVKQLGKHELEELVKWLDDLPRQRNLIRRISRISSMSSSESDLGESEGGDLKLRSIENVKHQIRKYR